MFFRGFSIQLEGGWCHRVFSCLQAAPDVEVVRSQNFNERIGRVKATDVALLVGENSKSLEPVTLDKSLGPSWAATVCFFFWFKGHSGRSRCLLRKKGPPKQSKRPYIYILYIL